MGPHAGAARGARSPASGRDLVRRADPVLLSAGRCGCPVGSRPWSCWWAARPPTRGLPARPLAGRGVPLLGRCIRRARASPGRASPRRGARSPARAGIANGRARADRGGGPPPIPDADAGGRGGRTDRGLPRQLRPGRRTCCAASSTPCGSRAIGNWICVISDDRSRPERVAEIERQVDDDQRFALSRLRATAWLLPQLRAGAAARAARGGVHRALRPGRRLVSRQARRAERGDRRCARSPTATPGSPTPRAPSSPTRSGRSGGRTPRASPQCSSRTASREPRR